MSDIASIKDDLTWFETEAPRVSTVLDLDQGLSGWIALTYIEPGDATCPMGRADAKISRQNAVMSNHQLLILDTYHSNARKRMTSLREGVLRAMPCMDHTHFYLTHQLLREDSGAIGATLTLSNYNLQFDPEPAAKLAENLAWMRDRLAHLPKWNGQNTWYLDMHIQANSAEDAALICDTLRLRKKRKARPETAIRHPMTMAA